MKRLVAIAALALGCVDTQAPVSHAPVCPQVLDLRWDLSCWGMSDQEVQAVVTVDSDALDVATLSVGGSDYIGTVRLSGPMAAGFEYRLSFATDVAQNFTGTLSLAWDSPCAPFVSDPIVLEFPETPEVSPCQ